jgi:platelet-activating factor acetylhydrolase
MSTEPSTPGRQTGGTQQTSEIRGNPSEQAKSKPATSIRDKVYSSLPRYSGVYSVGVIDIEVPVREPRTFSDIKRHKRHILELETVLFSVYYPSALGSGSGHDPAGRRTWNRQNWLTLPRKETSEGYAKFAGLPKWPMMFFFLCTTWFTMIPAHRNAHLATHWPPEGNARKGG